MLTQHLSPKITLGASEHHELTVLAMIASGHTADDSDNLNYELDRACIVPDVTLAPEIVRMGSIVTYRSEDGSTRTVTLAYPTQASAPANRISILTPVGTALIGLRAGQAISWTGRDGKFRELTVQSVTNPPPDTSALVRRHIPALV
jgi:regulator of nucleoside diphosphate kinase